MNKQKQITIDQTNYKLIETIGNGGSADVWKARSNENEYAIKIIRSSSEKNKIARFKKEIEFCKKNNHKNIIKIIAEGEQNGNLFYVMPLYSHTLRDLINCEKNADTLISSILKLCNALKFIHTKGIIHRDIKPENILIEGKDLVLADFGIAHFKDFQQTKKRDLLANRNYMAPEQKKGKNANSITEAADIFALGLIINECFTKQIPLGFNFKLIADSYPLYSDLDNLVTNMIRHNPENRLNINSVITEITFIHHKIKQDLKDIAFVLKEQTEFRNFKQPVLKTIIQRASEDILFGKILFTSKSLEELNKYNKNWHKKIGYMTDDFLFNLYVQEQIYDLCKAKFEYESNVYRNNGRYKTLDLENNNEHKLLYKQINDIVKKYKLSKNGESFFNLSGKILKYFSSCADYHCKEILNSIKREEDLAKANLQNAPIIWIVYTLKSGIIRNMEYLLNGINGLGGQYHFNFIEHISISSESIKNFVVNDENTELFDKNYRKSEREIQEVLSEFQRKWEIVFTKVDEKNYSIKFKTYIQFERFRKYALKLSRPYYIFEGDVMDILNKPNFIGDIVELKLNTVFEIPNTIAKIVGKRKFKE